VIHITIYRFFVLFVYDCSFFNVACQYGKANENLKKNRKFRRDTILYDRSVEFVSRRGK